MTDVDHGVNPKIESVAILKLNLESRKMKRPRQVEDPEINPCSGTVKSFFVVSPNPGDSDLLDYSV